MFTVTEPLANFLFNWSNILVAIGAAVGLIGVIGIFAMGAAKEQFSNERIFSNERATAEANERAANAELELARYRAPRTLTTEQRIQLSTRLWAFKGTKFDAGISNPDPEILTLFASIGSALKEAGWAMLKWDGGDVGFTLTSGEYLGITSARGVTIQIAKGAPNRLSEAATALASALTAEGIESAVEVTAVPASKNADTAHILIGSKP